MGRRPVRWRRGKTMPQRAQWMRSSCMGRTVRLGCDNEAPGWLTWAFAAWPGPAGGWSATLDVVPVTKGVADGGRIVSGIAAGRPSARRIEFGRPVAAEPRLG